MDGSPLLNMVAWSALYKPSKFDKEACAKVIDVLTGAGELTRAKDPIFETFPELRHLRRLGLNHLRRPDVVVFLDVDPVVACERIQSRGERKQVHETAEKLTGLREAYLKVCDVVEREWHVPTARVDGNRELEAISKEIIDFCRESIEREDAGIATN
jgi:deoxyadenosine/deoxycytidine kinase